jgi:hypothetical protein
MSISPIKLSTVLKYSISIMGGVLSGTPFCFDSFTIGLFGLAGVSGILSSKKAGSLFARGLGEKVLLHA